MTRRKTILIQKRPPKRNIPSNYRLITCLVMMWKILNEQIREMFYLIVSHVSTEKENRCHNGTRGTGDLYIDQHILKECKARRKKCSRSVNWLQRGQWYSPAILACRLSKNVQDIHQRYKIHHKSHEKLESWIVIRRKKHL